MLDYLTDPTLRAIFLPGFIAACCTVVLCALLSPVVVVKRLGFVGQGISHCAFGGVGLSALLAAMGWFPNAGWGETLVITIFCITAALGMAALAQRGKTPEDTSIGIFLVASMAAGALLVSLAREVARSSGRPVDGRSWESILFGSVSSATWTDAATAAIAVAAIALALFILRRPLIFYVFDEPAARAFGVRIALVRGALMVLLAITVVLSMRIAGVVLASAVLVLPGAIALRLSAQLSRVIALSIVAGLVGVVGGFTLALAADRPIGACVVLVLVAMFLLAAIYSALAPRVSRTG
jgi:zinc transport system permease protein